MVEPSQHILFNVGGHKYEVSRSLLNMHPNTMLARIASKEWNSEKNDGAIFIERNGIRFQFVLDYLRDGKAVSLPAIVSKKAFVADLVYFAVDNINEDLIDDRASNAWSLAHFHAQRNYMRVATLCVEHCMQDCTSPATKLIRKLEMRKSRLRADCLIADCVRIQGQFQKCNIFLEPFGLRLKAIMETELGNTITLQYELVCE